MKVSLNTYAAYLLLALMLSTNSHAATWSKLNNNPNSTLWLDKTSISKQNQHQKAWLKIKYHTPQKNAESVENKSYNTSKSLVYFDCHSQKSATTQVFHYQDQKLIYSAGVNAKNAVFIEPVPESDIEIGMRKVCGIADQAEKKAQAKKLAKARALERKKEAKANAEVDKTNGKKKKKIKPTEPKTSPKAEAKKSKADSKETSWGYSEKDGPEHWGKLSQAFSTCDAGMNQSPINIDATTPAALKKIKNIQKFSAKEILNNGHTLQVSFSKGNMIALDKTPFQLKEVNFHSPSENTIDGKSFPLEAQFVHIGKDNKLAIMAVMFAEGKENKALNKLWLQIPKKAGSKEKLKARVKPSDLMPRKKQYYRFNGSITTPPCSEGVRWVVLKAPNSISKEQIQKFKDRFKTPNNRPTQPLNSRIVLE